MPHPDTFWKFGTTWSRHIGPGIAFLGAVAALAALLAAAPASAVTVTIDDKGACPSWTWDSSTRTLSCGAGPGGGTPPACVAINGPTTGTVGAPITLTANCPGATGWSWTGGNCTGVTTSTCSAVSSVSGSVFYMVSAVTTNGTGAPAGYTVEWSPTPAFSCNFNPAPAAATAGTPLGLTVTCSNGTPVSFAWSATPPSGCSGGCTATWGSSAQTTGGANTVTLGAAGIWTVTATVTSTTAATSQAQASVQASTAGSVISCAAQGFSKTIVANWDWANSYTAPFDTYQMKDTAGGTGIGTNGILVVAFTPTAPSNLDVPDWGANRNTIDAIGFPPGQGNTMTLAISTQQCDLSTPDPGSSVSPGPTVTYGVGTAMFDGDSGKTSAFGLTPGVPYYINVAPRNGAIQTCVPGGGTCEFRLSVRKPPGH